MGEKRPLGTARGGRGSFPFFVIAGLRSNLPAVSSLRAKRGNLP